MENRDRKKNDPEAAGATMSGDRGGAGAAASLQTPNPERPPVPTLIVGSVLAARYEILRELGEGGMGAVYQARDRELDRLIAVKTVRPDLAKSPSSLQRFKQELILARQVTHRNVIRIYDLGESDGIKYITMEYVDGKDLRFTIREKLPVEQVVEIVKQICHALQAAHSEGVIHRDLKPQNIMRDKNGRVVVMDFGLARSLETAGLTQSGALVGTLEYMSPEQALGQEIDHRSDIFAMGIIFYELLTGEAPYKADSAIASLVRRTQESAVPAMELDQSIPEEVSDLVSRCLGRNVFERYQSAAEVIKALERWQATVAPSLPSVERPRPIQDLPTMPYSPHPKVLKAAKRRPKRLWIGIAALILVLIVAAILLPKIISRGSSGPHHAVTLLIADFKNATADPVFDGTLEPAFSIAMEGASFITAYDRRDAKRVSAQIKPDAKSLDDYLARLVAQREGVNVVIGGEIEKTDSGYKVSVQAVDALTSKTIANQSAIATDKNTVLSVIGKLASDIRKKLGDTAPDSTRLAAAETFTADSLESAHEYAVGQQAQWDGKYDEAIKHYSRTIEIDQNLGRAYAGIAVMYGNMGQRQQAEKYYQLAMAHIDRMSQREKYRTRAAYYLSVRHDGSKAAEELNELLQHYPDDTSGRANLALAYFYQGDLKKSVEEAQRALALNPSSIQQRNNLALYAMYAGDFATAQREAQTVLEKNPSFLKAYVALALSKAAQGKIEDARATFQKLQQVNARGESFANIGLADLLLYESKTGEAIKTLEAGIAADLKNNNQSAAAIKMIAVAQAHLMRGENAAALDNAEKAIAASKDQSVLYSAAVINLRAGKEKHALEMAQDLEGRLDPEPQIYGKLIEAESHVIHGHPRDGVRIATEAQKISDTWLGRFVLGKAYLATSADSATDAYNQFDNCINRRGEATAVFLDDVPSFRFFPEVYYYLGRSQQGLHSPGATDSFNTYLQIKKDADNDPLIADTKKRALQQ
jgi:eukaryotic-like serine/threonine-protein kinase